MLSNDPSGADVRLLDSMGAGQNHNDREAYLRVLAGREPATSFLELRHRVGPETLTARFFAVNDFARIVAAIQRRSTLADVYIGCAPRCRRSGTRRDVARVWVLWAECDGAAAAHAAQHYDPQPAIVVGSGSGDNVHAYWPLREPLSPQEAERANLRLAHAIGADRACFDVARILRPPGSWNHKHQPPAPVRAIRLDAGTRFDAHRVLRDAPAVDDLRVERRWDDRHGRDARRDPLLQIEPARYVSELLGVQARPGRKVRCPFHRDERPSLHVHPTAERGWCCFSCGRGGSIYDLAAALWSIPPRGREFIELKQLLAERFADEVRRPVRAVARELP
jgi:hypothetical protein